MARRPRVQENLLSQLLPTGPTVYTREGGIAPGQEISSRGVEKGGRRLVTGLECGACYTPGGISDRQCANQQSDYTQSNVAPTTDLICHRHAHT